MVVSEFIELLMDNLDLDTEIDIMRTHYDGNEDVNTTERPAILYEDKQFALLIPDNAYSKQVAKHDFFREGAKVWERYLR